MTGWIVDTFDRPNQTGLGTSDSGHVWNGLFWKILDNNAIPDSRDQHVWTGPIPGAKYRIDVVLAAPPGELVNTNTVTFRVVDGGVFHWLQISFHTITLKGPFPTVPLLKQVAAPYYLYNGAKVSLINDGSLMRVLVDDVELFTHIDATNANATGGAGVWGNSNVNGYGFQSLKSSSLAEPFLGLFGLGGLLAILPTGPWVTKLDMPTTQSASCAAFVNGKFYVFGGSVANTAVYEYSLSTNTWATKTPLPTGREHPACAVVDGIIYVIAGLFGANKVEAYNPATDTWTTRANLPDTRIGGGAAAINGKVYYVGGSGASENELFEYTPSSNTWVTKAVMPTPRRYLAAVARSGKLHVLGGTRSSFGVRDTHESYDPATNTWTTHNPMPVSLWKLVAVVIGTTLYVGTGSTTESDGTQTNAWYRWNSASDTWTALASSSQVLDSAAAAAGDGAIFLAGGGLPGYIKTARLEVYS